jgi:hypothetical protein
VYRQTTDGSKKSLDIIVMRKRPEAALENLDRGLFIVFPVPLSTLNRRVIFYREIPLPASVRFLRETSRTLLFSHFRFDLVLSMFPSTNKRPVIPFSLIKKGFGAKRYKAAFRVSTFGIRRLLEKNSALLLTKTGG